jgi:Fe-S cluster assembly scaffold protein SufB
VAEVIAAVNEDTDATRCGGKGDCQEGDTCLTHHLWMDLSDQIRAFLDGISLADLVQRNEIREISEKQVHRNPEGLPDSAQILILVSTRPETRSARTAEHDAGRNRHRIAKEYAAGFITDIESDTLAPGLDEDVIRFISAKKNEPEWLLEWRLEAYREWQKMDTPEWAHVHYPRIDYKALSYYSSPKNMKDGPKSLDEVDPELLATYEKLGIPLHEQEMLAGVAVDAVFDSVSVATTFREKLAEAGVIFCSISEAVHEVPGAGAQVSRQRRTAPRQLLRGAQQRRIQRRLLRLHPQGCALPHGAVHLFPHQRGQDGQFERTLIIADEGSHVSYLEGCTAPMRDENQLHAAVVELVALDRCRDQVLHGAELVSRRRRGQGRHLQLRDQARRGSHQQQDLLDPGRDRLRVTWKYPSCVLRGDQQRRRVLLRGAHQQHAAGRHGHEDDPSRAQHEVHDHLQGHLRRAAAPTPTAAWCA